MNLTPHFTLEEFIHSDTASAMGISNAPPADVQQNLYVLACVMEKVRAICGGHPVYISSGFRCPDVNRAVGGVSNSAHLYGCAVDFTIPAFGNVPDTCRKLQGHLNELWIDQLIDESGGGADWVHLGIAVPPYNTSRGQCFTMRGGVTTTGFA